MDDTEQLAAPEQLADSAHPTQATTGCNADAELRAAGYRIHARPADGEAVWIWRGILFSDDEARQRAGVRRKRKRRR
jgi:hypothetical protein